MQIILCNDDGDRAEGYEILWKTLGLKFLNATCSFWAPTGNHSGCGSAISIRGLLGPHSTPMDNLRAGIARVKPDWVIAGLNDGANIGRMMLCSGTVCLAAYAAEEGIPAIALSQHRPLDPDKPDFTNAHERLETVLQLLFKMPPPPGYFYNVNLPLGRGPWRGPIGCAERGSGGYIPKPTHKSFVTEFVTEWRDQSYPEQLLEQGHAVIQLMRTMHAVDIANNPWGSGKGSGGA